MNKIVEALINKLAKHFGKRGQSILISFIGADHIPYTFCSGEVAFIVRSIAESIVTIMDAAHLTKDEMEQLVSVALVQTMFGAEIREADDDGLVEEDEYGFDG